jgi:hypothetical protein
MNVPPERDVLEWEMEQVELIKKLAIEYGDGMTETQYRAKLKLVQSAALRAQKERARGHRGSKSNETADGAIQEGGKREKPISWANQARPFGKGRACKDFKEAKEEMLGEPPWGSWINDRDAPSGTNWRRYIAIDPGDSTAYKRLRIVHNKGYSM